MDIFRASLSCLPRTDVRSDPKKAGVATGHSETWPPFRFILRKDKSQGTSYSSQPGIGCGPSGKGRDLELGWCLHGGGSTMLTVEGLPPAALPAAGEGRVLHSWRGTLGLIPAPTTGCFQLFAISNSAVGERTAL